MTQISPDDIAEIKADLKHALRLMERHDKTLYGEDGGNGLVSHVTRHNEKENQANRLIAAIVGLALMNIGAIAKVVWSHFTKGQQ